jgi:hypothetical protein
MSREMPNTTREYAQLEESIAHERKCVSRPGSRDVHYPARAPRPTERRSHPPHRATPTPRISIGEARLAEHAATMRRDAEARRAASASAEKKPPAPSAHPEDDFTWPVLGTALHSHRRQNVRHWKDALAEPEPLL